MAPRDHTSSAIARLPRARFLPKHSPGLPIRSYLRYGASFVVRASAYPSIEDVWRPLLSDRRIVATPTGRHALWFFLEAAGLVAGDEVLVSAFNYFVVVRVLVQRGLVPVFVDIDPTTLCIDASAIEPKITSRSRMVIATHMFGNPAPIARIRSLCERRGLLLFEDCAHGVGTEADGRHVGRHGDGALFSFGLWKSLSSFGGGMLCLRPGFSDTYTPPTHRADWARSHMNTAARVAVSSVLRKGPYGYLFHPLLEVASTAARLGFPALRDLIAPPRDDASYRFDIDARAPFRPFMTAVHADQLLRLGADLARRKQIVDTVKRALRDVEEIVTLDENKHGTSNGSYTGVYVPDPEALSAHLETIGIVARPYEFLDCASLPQFARFAAQCPHASYATRHLLRLPSFPSLSDDDVYAVTSSIVAFFRRARRASAPVPLATGRARGVRA